MTASFDLVEFATDLRDNLARWLKDDKASDTVLGGVIADAYSTLVLVRAGTIDPASAPTDDDVRAAFDIGWLRLTGDKDGDLVFDRWLIERDRRGDG